MKNLLYLGNKLSSKGLNVTTIDTLSKQIADEGFAVVTSSSKKNQLLRLFDMLLSVIVNRKADYVLIDTYSTSAFWYAFFTSQLCRLLKMKYLPILHGGNLPSRIESSPIPSKMIFKNAYINVAPSEYLLFAFENKGYKNLIHIPNTIETEQYPFTLRKNIKPNLLWVRAFASIYNPKMAVDVLYRLKQKFPEATLTMVGPDKDGSLIATEKYANSLHLNVNFTGRLSKKEWILLSSNCDVFINTTHFDNLPVSVIEAMCLGLPVVSTNVGGLPYLLNDGLTGLLVNPDDTNAMVKAIETLVTNTQLYTELAQNAKEKAQSFDWQLVKNKWINILK
ncbi:MAG: glycosyltransferase family 4 protein [Flavobacterium sp.]|nr:glycosyltransferase family 4 protein [Flavobacterium sp.]